EQIEVANTVLCLCHVSYDLDSTGSAGIILPNATASWNKSVYVSAKKTSRQVFLMLLANEIGGVLLEREYLQLMFDPNQGVSYHRGWHRRRRDCHLSVRMSTPTNPELNGTRPAWKNATLETATARNLSISGR